MHEGAALEMARGTRFKIIEVQTLHQSSMNCLYWAYLQVKPPTYDHYAGIPSSFAMVA